MPAHRVCELDELPPGQKRIVKLGKVTVGVFNVDGTVYALRNICPHHGAELCLGVTAGTMMPSPPGEWSLAADAPVVRCPRHRWEFSLKDGRSVIDPQRYRVRAYEVRVVDGCIEVEV
jgi:3-phenylpropionate/trans-cinnamate dioxygenase ferredoxin subunit